MKITLSFLPFALTSVILATIPNLQGDLSALDPLLRGLAELPLVVGAVWLVIRLQDKEQEHIKQLMGHFEQRAQAKDTFYQTLVTDLVETIEQMANK